MTTTSRRHADRRASTPEGEPAPITTERDTAFRSAVSGAEPAEQAPRRAGARARAREDSAVQTAPPAVTDRDRTAEDGDHAHDAERVVLGSMMLDAGVFDTVTDRLTSASFHLARHGTLYAHLTAAWAAGEPTDPVALLGRMSAEDDRQIGGAVYLHDCVQAVPTAAQVGYYVDLVADAAERRGLAEQAARLFTAARTRDRDQRRELLEQIRHGLEAAESAESELDQAPVHQMPSYPAGEVPGPLAELVAARGGLPAALVAGAGLAALAAVCPTATLAVADSWAEYPILWIPLAAPRGAGKTPAMNLALAPIRDRDSEAHRLYADQMSVWRDTPPRERGSIGRPTDPTRLIDDITVEMLARRLAATSGAATIAPDELSGMLGQLDRYHRGSGDRGRMLQLWSSGPWRYQRVTDELDILIPRPVVSIVGGIQPALHRLLGGEEDGMRPRWLPHLAPLTAGGPIATTPASWTHALATLHDDSTDRTWRLDTTTEHQWSQAQQRWKNDAGAPTVTASTSGAMRKADIHAARIALVLAESIEPGKGGPIPPEAMSGAVAIVDYVVDCWRALPEANSLALTRRDETLDRAVDQLRAWLEEHGGRATRRDLKHAHVAGCRTTTELDALIERYRAIYPHSVRTERPAGRGRPSLTVYAPGHGDRT